MEEAKGLPPFVRNMYLNYTAGDPAGINHLFTLHVSSSHAVITGFYYTTVQFRGSSWASECVRHNGSWCHPSKSWRPFGRTSFPLIAVARISPIVDVYYLRHSYSRSRFLLFIVNLNESLPTIKIAGTNGISTARGCFIKMYSVSCTCVPLAQMYVNIVLYHGRTTRRYIDRHGSL